ncbi:nuclear transport factor 2 family protein [Embleya sp. NBC_00896]|uniref:nuclear transport factor 2 family protein n=1 Tax=Embleya sp. NBC_00896 TaxID=2975961 RepID=UPI00386ECACC|nr:nuclear transport factor 2 family protein [Embleya sp. NBC_00896]
MTAAPSLTAEDVAGIHDTLALFAHVFDNDGVADLDRVFTDDAVIENTIGNGYTIEGLDSARQFTGRRSPDTPDHQTLDTILLVGADGIVRARSRYIATLIDGEVHGGDYFDILESTPRGWRIRYRISVPRHPILESIELPAEFAEPWRPTAENVVRFVRQ